MSVIVLILRAQVVIWNVNGAHRINVDSDVGTTENSCTMLSSLMARIKS